MTGPTPSECTAAASLVEILRSRARQQPARLAYTFLPDGEREGARLTYAELDAQARLVAQRLLANGRPGDRVLLLYAPGLEFVSAFMGVFYAGMIAVPSSPPSGRKGAAQRVLSILRDAGAAWIATTCELLPKLQAELGEIEGLAESSWLTTDRIDPVSDPVFVDPRLRPDALALLQYTSGSTGTPKGVMVSHGNILANSDFIRVALGTSTETVSVTWLPNFHDMGLIEGVLQPTFTGFPVVIMPPLSFVRRPTRWLHAISRYRGTHSGAPDFAYQECIRRTSEAELAQLDLRSWATAYSGAEPVRPHVVRAFCDKFARAGFDARAFYPCYGLAESTLIAAGGAQGSGARVLELDPIALEAHRVVLAEPGARPVRKVVGCGRAWLGAEIAIVDPETRVRRAEDHTGEIWLAGPSVALGYFQRADASAETFGARIAGASGRAYLRTGDLGFLHDGELFVTGRCKDTIVIRGRNLYAHDIESTVERSHPLLRPAGGAAFSIPGEGEELLVVLQELERGARACLDVEAIAGAIRQAVVEEHDVHVHTLLFLQPGSVPKTTSGKIQRSACRAAFLAGSLRAIARSELPGRAMLGAPDARAGAASLEPSHEGRQDSRAPAANGVTPSTAPRGSRTRACGVVRGPGELTLLRLLQQEAAQVLGLDAEAVDPERPLSPLGLNSLKAAELAGRLETELGRPVSVALFYEHPTLAGLAAHLASALPATSGVRRSPTSAEPQRSDRDPIAVVGMACRFPGAASPEALFRLLLDRVDAIGDVPIGRWDRGLTERSLVDRDRAALRGGFLDDLWGFDPVLFGVAPKEAAVMDPQQRMLLEVAWEALERAGLAADRLEGSQSGVFVGASSADYLRVMAPGLEQASLYRASGGALSMLANRLSYRLHWHGPSFVVDTACSSSLAALHLALRSLRDGECDLALVAGVNALLDPQISLAFARANMLSPAGRPRPFDAAADGYVRAEGCGVVVLERLSDARRAGRHVHALVRGSAQNHGGRSQGLTAPNGGAQEQVIRAALRDAKVEPWDVGYVEAHGTGTVLGDPIELRALSRALHGEQGQGACRVGSVKANLGHLEAAAGIAGLIKAVLVLEAGRIPGQANFERCNPGIELGPELVISTETVAWHSERRVAGVSSFGFGGANVHVVLENDAERRAAAQRGESRPPPASFVVEGSPEPGAPAEPSAPRSRPEPFVLSAASSGALCELVRRWKQLPVLRPQHSGGQPGAGEPVSLVELSAASIRARAELDERLFVVADSPQQLVEQLDAALEHAFPEPASAGSWARRGIVRARRRPRASIVFLFGGQGSQRCGAGAELYAVEPVFRDRIDRCAALFAHALPRPLTELMFESQPAALQPTAVAQPVLFAFAWALAEQWRAWGVEPAAVLGHSAGEIAAACVAGVLDLPAAVQLVVARARRMQALDAPGAMIAVNAAPERVLPLLAGRERVLAIAAVNAPRRCVVSGAVEAIASLEHTLAAERVAHVRLPVSHAFHSPLVEPMLDGLAADLAHLQLRVPAIPIASNVSGTLVSSELAQPAYFVAQCRQPVLFGPAVRELLRHGHGAFLELSASPALLRLAQLNDSDGVRPLWLPSVREGQGERASLLESLGQLWAHGASGMLDAVCPPAAVRGAALPSYPFERAPLDADSRASVDVDVERTPWAVASTAVGVEHGPPGAGATTPGEACTARAMGPSDRSARSASEGLDRRRAAVGGGVEVGAVPALFRMHWSAGPVPSVGASAPGIWLVRCPDAALLGAVCSQLEAADVGTRELDSSLRGDALRAALGRVLRELPAVCGVLFVVDRLPDGPVGDLGTGLHDALACIQALLELHAESAARLVLATHGAVHVGGDASRPADEAGVSQATVWGLGRTFSLEAPGRFGGLCDLDPHARADERAAALVAELRAHAAGESAWRAGRRYAPCLQRLDSDAGPPSEADSEPAARDVRPSASPRFAPAPRRVAADAQACAAVSAALEPRLRLRPDRTYLLSGGLGELGVRVASHLVDRGARQLLLLGRRPPSPLAQRSIAQLRAAGAEVGIIALDLAEPDASRRVRAAVSLLGRPLAGVVHAAGVTADATLQQQTPARLDQALSPKLRGALSLHAAVGGGQLEFFLLCSSLAATLGSAGQAAYAAANAGLSALARFFAAQGTPALAVEWGPWRGVGMTARAEAARRFDAHGVRALEPDAAARGLDGLLEAVRSGSARGQTLVAASFDREALAGSGLSRAACLRTWLGEAAPRPDAWVAQLRGDEPKQRESRLRELVRALLVRALGHHDSRALDPQRGFFTLGLDSLMALEIRNRLESELGVRLPATVAFDYPTIADLAGFLAGELARGFGEDRAVAAPSPRSTLEEADAHPDLEAALADELERLDALLER